MEYLMVLMRVLLVVAILFSGNVFARMYQWTDPDSESTQFSGKPPAWYRSTTGGPRVFVFDNGRLIDDTAVAISDEKRQQLRQRAFVLGEEDRQKAREKNAKAQLLKQKYVKEKSKKPEQFSRDDLDEKSSIAAPDTDELIADEDPDEEQKKSSYIEDELRKLIADWDKSKTESARESVRKVLE